MKNRMKLITILMLAAIFLGACMPGLLNVVPVVSGPEPTIIAISTIPANTASIRGRVWHDLCALAGGEGGVPVQPSAGCVLSETGGIQANGIREADEPGLGDVLVSLGYGACEESRDHFEVRTNADGSFVFTDLPAGTYCLAVDSLRSENGHLLPGQWTSPEGLGNTGAAQVTVTLQSGEEKADVNFGWDYQFLPAPSVSGSTSLRGVVNVQGLNLRVGPSGDHKILRQLAEGTQVEIQGRSENMEWLLVRLSSGTQGWVFAEYVDTQAVIASLPLKEASGGAYLAPSDIPQSRNVQVSIENNIATVDILGFTADTKLIVTLSRPGGKDDLVVGRGSTSADGKAVIRFEMPSEWPDGSLLKGGGLVLVVSSKDGKASVKVNIQYFR
jgi:hypothetical protein